MSPSSGPVRRLRIDRLDLDLRGIAPATAESAARALGPALARALARPPASHDVHVRPSERIDAGRVESPASPGAQDLATGIADRIARSIRGEGR